jgi:hypothetical protein
MAVRKCTVIGHSAKSACTWKCADIIETHASRFEVPGWRISDPEVQNRPRSTMVSTRSHACITRERRVGRYYDPFTEQFLSVDPDVAETGQPYEFTGDDPLNATDPLGLRLKKKTLGRNTQYLASDGIVATTAVVGRSQKDRAEGLVRG